MTKYSFNISEEIARWAVEIYIKEIQKDGWWIAFTNPVAGPWKKISALKEDGGFIEIHRFEREDERPDLVLVNDRSKLILIVEAKDYVQKITPSTQMIKSIRVINEMKKVLLTCENPHWGNRKSYTIIPSFLWFTNNPTNIISENNLVKKSYSESLGENENQLINITLSYDQNENLEVNFVFLGTIHKHLVLTN